MKKTVFVVCLVSTMLIALRFIWRSPSSTLAKYLCYDIIFGHDQWCKVFWPQVIDPAFDVETGDYKVTAGFIPYLPDDYELYFNVADAIADGCDEHEYPGPSAICSSRSFLDVRVMQGHRMLVSTNGIPMHGLRRDNVINSINYPLAVIPMGKGIVGMPISVSVRMKGNCDSGNNRHHDIRLMVRTTFSE